MNSHNFCPGFTFVRTAYHKDPHSGTSMHSDAALYSNSDMADMKANLTRVEEDDEEDGEGDDEEDNDEDDEEESDEDDEEEEDSDFEDEEHPGAANQGAEDDSEYSIFCYWPLIQIIIEFKCKSFMDPYRYAFSDKKTILDNPSHCATRSRGQMLTYAGLQMAHQFRRSVFAVGIYGSYARFFHIDPSSVVVSERFSIHDSAKILVEFFLRYAALTPTQRGFDPTVTPATEAEKILFRSHVKSYLERVKKENLRKYPGIDNVGNTGFPISKVGVSDEDGNLHLYLVCRPDSPIRNFVPCGRFTRGFIAVPIASALSSTGAPAASANVENSGGDSQSQNVGDGRLYWLKDCWRPANSESETAMYKHLDSTKVPNLTEVICGGDVYFDGTLQQTENDSLLVDPKVAWRRPTLPIRRMVHHRLVQALLIPLYSDLNERELLRVGRDVLESGFILMIFFMFFEVLITSPRSDRRGIS